MDDWRTHALAAKGFMPPDEGDALHAAARAAAAAVPDAPFVEIGSYCGRSTIWLGAAARAAGTVVFAVDHHRGSEENQPGWEYHDTELVDQDAGKLDTLSWFRRTIRLAGLEDHVVAMVTRSKTAADLVAVPLGMVFIDGGHTFEAAHADYESWSEKIAPGGILAIHDLLPDPTKGGQAPIEIYRRALASGLFDELPTTKTLGVLRRKK
jgi:predicted O-methyltransferase YrrM